MFFSNCCRLDPKLTRVNAVVSLLFSKFRLIFLGHEPKKSINFLRERRHVFERFGLCFWEIIKIVGMKCLSITWVGYLNNLLVERLQLEYYMSLLCIKSSLKCAYEVNIKFCKVLLDITWHFWKLKLANKKTNKQTVRNHWDKSWHCCIVVRHKVIKVILEFLPRILLTFLYIWMIFP